MESFLEGIFYGICAVFICVVAGVIFFKDALGGVPTQAKQRVGWSLLCSIAYGMFCWATGINTLAESTWLAVGYFVATATGLMLGFYLITRIRSKRVLTKSTTQPASLSSSFEEPSNEELVRRYDTRQVQAPPPPFPPYSPR